MSVETADGRRETFAYDDAIVRSFVLATVVWGLVGMLVGLVVALELVAPALSGERWSSSKNLSSK